MEKKNITVGGVGNNGKRYGVEAVDQEVNESCVVGLRGG